jgi:hypothetical protein
MFEGTDSVLNSESVSSKISSKIYLCKISTVITETLLVQTSELHVFYLE